MSNLNKKYLGSAFDNFLSEQNMIEEVTTTSHKHVLAMQIKVIMENKHITRTDMAKKMHTSRSAVNRLLNPDNLNTTLDTLDRAAHALGMKLNISIV